MQGSVTTIAHPNIALVKYWGKRDLSRNLPATDSLSITLDTLTTTTQIFAHRDSDADTIRLNGEEATAAARAKVIACVERFRTLSGVHHGVTVQTENNFPTAAGLASSASGFAALVLGLNWIFDTRLNAARLSEQARLGSGSAPRSLFGGFVKMHKGEQDDGGDAIATPIASSADWPLEVVVAITSEEKKTVSSTQGMESTRMTSPFYSSWCSSHDDDMRLAQAAIQLKDFEKLADVSEHSCLKMHGVMFSADPGLIYWNAATLACIQEIRAMRSEGFGVFFTVDAGPQVKAVCMPQFSERVRSRLGALPGVERTLVASLGDGARILSQP